MTDEKPFRWNVRVTKVEQINDGWDRDIWWIEIAHQLRICAGHEDPGIKAGDRVNIIVEKALLGSGGQ